MMASYKAGVDPPNRPEDSRRSGRRAGYMAPTIRSESRERGNIEMYGQFESRRAPTPDRSRQTSLPRPRMREPSPSIKTAAEAKSSAGFSFGRSTTKTTITGPPPELKGKSSRNVLRRKQSSIAKQQPKADPPAMPPIAKARSTSPAKWSNASERRPSIESSLRSAEAYDEIFTRPARARTESPQIIPELDRYRIKPDQNQGFHSRTPEIPKLSTQDLPLATPLSSGSSGTPNYGALSSNPNRYSGYSGSGYSASPSTLFSESPGPGAYSRDTTPTSMSSQTPGIIAPLKITTPRLKQSSSPAFTRPPVTRRRAGSISSEVETHVADNHGLPVLAESLTSSSSNSTVKGDGNVKGKPKKGLSSLPPNPPPRKSSQKLQKERSSEDSPTKSSKKSSESTMMPSDLSPSKSFKSVPKSQLQGKNMPPVRPSREGTPSLEKESRNVIQSNLAGIPISQNRRQSALPRGTSPLLSPSSQQGSKLPSRNPSPSPILASRREGTPAPAGLGIIPNLKPPQEQHPAHRPPLTRTPSPSVANPKPRFGLFGRRTKTAPEVPTLENTDKMLRKGPAAGTGHEGYGKYAARGRSTSTGGAGRLRDRSMSGAHSSQESVASSQTHDPFLLERISPVVIAGGGEIIENRNSSIDLARMDSNTSVLYGRPSTDSRGSSKTNLSQEVNRNTLWPSAFPKDTKRTSLAPKGRRPSDSSDDEMGKPTLALRRSIQRLNGSSGTLNLPKPIAIPGMGISPSLKSLESSILSEDSQMERLADLDRGRKGQLTKPRKLEKRPKSPRKWNFFHRSQPGNKEKEKVEVAMPVTIGRPPVKAIPHYALLDSSDEQMEPDEMDLKDILRAADVDVDVVDLSNEELDALQFGAYKENLRRIENLNTMIETGISIPERSPMIFSSPEPIRTPEIHHGEELPGPKDISPKQPSPLRIVTDPIQHTTDMHLTTEPAPTRPSRLAQVGRIPKVISARPVATSPKSFSRPFARLSTVQPLHTAIIFDKDSVALGPSPPKPSTPEPETEQRTAFSRISSESKSDTASLNHRDFLAFSPRKNSETTTTSSSGGFSVLGTTAVVPEADAVLAEDEVWDEYDDLMGNVGDKAPVSATSSHGNPFQYESYETRRLRKSKFQGMDSPALPKMEEPPSPIRTSIATSSSVYSVDINQKLKETLAPECSPTTPMSFTDFFSGYGDRNNSTPGNSGQKPRRSSQSSRKSNGSSNHNRTTSGLVTITEQESNSPVSQVNLRVGSMTVSKWLTFGHVLFSPARDELMQLEGSKRHSILVIDGLGNGKSCNYMFSIYYTNTANR